MEILLVLVILVALTFDFTNGFHDTANSIATLVGTRAMGPQPAVIMAALLNFFGAFISIEVAATVGKDVVSIGTGTPALEVVLAGLVGAIVWNLITWYFGLPSSSSHALVGGLVGAALAFGGTSAVLWQGVTKKVLIPSVLAPTLGLLGGLLLMWVLMRVTRSMNPAAGNRLFRRLQLFTGGWLSLTHGMNDAQKTMGIMALALVTTGALPADFTDIPFWVKFSAAAAMGLGTYAGGWKIIKTLGGKVVKMSPLQGFAASSSAAMILQAAGQFGFPVSTTHCVSGSVLGAGASKRLSAVRWNVAGDIVSAWLLTLPCAAFVGAVAYALTAIHPMVLALAAGAALVAVRHKAAQSGLAPAH